MNVRVNFLALTAAVLVSVLSLIVYNTLVQRTSFKGYL